MPQRGQSFNEARAFPPGKWVAAGTDDRPKILSFNEARAFPPGKWGSRGALSSPLRGFNEARAFPPGKWSTGGKAPPAEPELQ